MTDASFQPCSTSPSPAKTRGAPPPGSCHVGDPCDVATGNNYQHTTDYSSGGSTPLEFSRYYNSNTNPSAVTSYGPGWPELGSNWRSNFDRVLTFTYADANVAPIYNGQDLALVYRPDGKIVMFTISGNTYTPLDADMVETLTQTGTYQWQFTTADDTVESYEETDFGIELQSIRYRSGVTQTLTYNQTTGLLTKVTDNFGRRLSFTYNSNGRLATVRNLAGQAYKYAYNAKGYLSKVTYPDSTYRQYKYGDSTYPGALTSIVDEIGQTYASWSYDSQGRVVSSQHAGDTDSYAMSYSSSTQTTVTEPLGGVKQYTYAVILGVPKVQVIPENRDLDRRNSNQTNRRRILTETHHPGRHRRNFPNFRFRLFPLRR